MFEGTIQFLKMRESSFKGKEGNIIDMCYVTVLTSQGDVTEFTAAKEIIESLKQFNNGDKCEIHFALSQNQERKLKAKIYSIEAVA